MRPQQLLQPAASVLLLLPLPPPATVMRLRPRQRPQVASVAPPLLQPQHQAAVRTWTAFLPQACLLRTMTWSLLTRFDSYSHDMRATS